ncbi:MAG: hypothetical protein DRO36_06870 [Candidatus Hecatellales archaeon]|nr:MAG: hypothetical protein DRO36_06870 [Candidatus Hecatellales archaeon]
MEKRIDEEEPPKRIWLTDTVYCGRKKIWRMMGYRERFTERQLNAIWLGLIVGEALKSLGIAGEVPVEYRGIRGRIDVILETGEPMETKVVKSLYVSASEYARTHVQQLSRYCLAKESEYGVLFHYVPGLSISNLPAYRYRFDLKAVKRETDERLDLLFKAEDAMDPFILPPTWHSETMDNWECRNCPFQMLCRQGRGGVL